jgi:hypothetical protein
MHSPRFLGLALSLLLLSPTREAAGKQKPFARPLASTKLEFRLNGPEIQHLENDEAEAALQAFTADTISKVDKKNLEEFRFQHDSLVSRGFEARTKPLNGRVFGSARSFLVRPFETQELPAINGDEAYTSASFEFRYEQSFLEKGAAPQPHTLLPFVELRGFIFVRCRGKKEECTRELVSIQDVVVRWGHLPSGRGANSSAGGAGQN